MNGAIIYSGPSMIDGSPIVAIATGLQRPSANAKTGAMVQTWILRADMAPLAAVASGADASICGDCAHRGAVSGAGRTCYVNVGNAPQAVYRAYVAGRYATCPDVASLGAGRLVRMGAYGDPAAVPVSVWQSLVSRSAGHTGYTHQWLVCDPALRSLVMASADSPAEAMEARAAGWRTFRVGFGADPARMPGEAICPASAESGHATTCADCLQCDGGAGRSIAIRVHGGSVVLRNAAKFVQLREVA